MLALGLETGLCPGLKPLMVQKEYGDLLFTMWNSKMSANAETNLSRKEAPRHRIMYTYRYKRYKISFNKFYILGVPKKNFAPIGSLCKRKRTRMYTFSCSAL